VTGLRHELRETATAIAPVALCAGALLVAMTAPGAQELGTFVLGVMLTVIGLALFLEGVRLVLLPIGEAVGARVTSVGSLTLILAVGLAIGTLITLAEPDVRILVGQIERADALAAPRWAYVVVVAGGVGISLAVALLRSVLDLPLIPLMLAGYAIIGVLAVIAPLEAIAFALDFGAVTTGPVSVPVLLALNAGVVTALGGQGDVSRTFGLLGIASIGPVIAVLLLLIVAGGSG
jgi:hypothetical protein